jgi:hypothetical protein
MSMSEVATKVNDLLGRLGVSPETFDRGLGSLARAPIAALRDLRVAYSKALVEANKFATGTIDARVNLPPFCFNPPPQDALSSLRGFLSATYFQPPETKHETAEQIDRVFNLRTRRAAILQRLLNENTHVRAAFERIAGGLVIPDGRMDGTIAMQERSKREKAGAPSAVSTGAMTGSSSSTQAIVVNGSSSVPPPTSPPSPPPGNLNALLAAMDAAVMKAAQAIRPGYGSYEASKGSLGSLIDGPFPSAGGGSSYGLDGGDEDSQDGEEGSGDDGSSSSTSSTSASGALTAGPPAPISQLPEANAGRGKSSDSVDVGTLQLQRILTKRDQMYDLVRQVFDKYNSNAMAAINNLKG